MSEPATPAFVFTDLVGFTSFTELHGDQAAADLAEQFCARVSEINEGHDAEDVKTLGDGCMIHVPDAGCAAHLGLESVEALGPRTDCLTSGWASTLGRRSSGGRLVRDDG